MEKLSKDGSTKVTDEIINSASHLAGAIFAILGVVLLIVRSSILGKVWHIVSFSIYGASLILVFLASAAHHGVNTSKKLEDLLRLSDYLAIFPLIAGTFTPICLIFFRTPFGWSFFGVIWGLAAMGITLKSVFPKLPKWVTGTMYICMGWIGGILVMALPFLNEVGILGFLFLIGGAVFYSLGFIVYNLEKPNPIPGKFGFHEIWHILVILGALSHYLMMFLTILPK